ncbi:ABC transporter permease [Kitasatospora sp. NBC_00240]|uniref:branched-chain amino acid ABC transporter permease n=1 Tax=Kitasatospora sp. NBC_00240 TaxID=2903567 RepID=UPI002257116D|nr:ABC transporter permease [Kitasatospora sp. NBC_00240]MCX5215439.1 ABC transporter permease [Kitasatospora sp. NBC_00240]
MAAAVAGLVVVVFVATQAWVAGSFTGPALFAATVSGLAVGAIFALAAAGLVVTYVTSGIFNFAQGAIGMLMAFLYWELRVNQGWPAPLCLALVLGVAAPAFGVGCAVIVMRRIRNAPVVQQVMVTVGLMLALIGIVGVLWPSAEISRSLPPFFGTTGFHLAGIVVTWHRLIAIGLAVLVSAALRLLLFRTRFGVAMRACVDDQELAALHGARPNVATMAAWALGSSLAALAGIMLAPEIPFSVVPLTLLIIDAFAAAILGRLRSLPLTFLGAVLLGLLNAYAITFLDLNGRWSNVRPAIPTVFLLIVLLALPQRRIPLGRIPMGAPPVRVRGVRSSALGMAALILLSIVLALVLPDETLDWLILAVITSLIMLSLVPLIGWAGEISLAPMTFAGIGAFAMVRVSDHNGILLGLAAAAVLAVTAGLAMASLAIRLQGLYMALASLAFARMAELLIFPQPELFGQSSSNTIGVPPEVLATWHLTSARLLLVLTTASFAVLATGLLVLRASRYGRRLIAVRDSPAACAALGIDITRVKLAVYALSSAVAGFAGAILAVHRKQVDAGEFSMLANLPVVLLLVIAGITTVSGALLGGFLFMALAVMQSTWQSPLFQTLGFLGPGLVVVAVAYTGDGAAPAIAAAIGRLRPSQLRGDPRHDLVDPGELGTTRPFTSETLKVVEDQLSLPEEYRRDAPGT